MGWRALDEGEGANEGGERQASRGHLYELQDLDLYSEEFEIKKKIVIT